MDPQNAIDFSRDAIKACLMIGGPILATGLLIGLVVGVFQAVTQIQDQTVSFVPKTLGLVAMIGLCLPWLTDQMLDFSKTSFETPMTHWDGAPPSNLFPATTDSVDQTAASEVGLKHSPPMRQASFAPSSVEESSEKSKSPFRLQAPAVNSDADSPFILPHYRFSKIPKTDIGG